MLYYLKVIESILMLLFVFENVRKRHIFSTRTRYVCVIVVPAVPVRKVLPVPLEIQCTCALNQYEELYILKYKKYLPFASSIQTLCITYWLLFTFNINDLLAWGLFSSALYFNFTKMYIIMVIIIQNVLEIYNNVLNSSNTPGWMELQAVNDMCDLYLDVLCNFSIRSIVHKVNYYYRMLNNLAYSGLAH